MGIFEPWTFYFIPWLAAVLTGLALAAVGRRWWQALGIALMTVPVWDTLWGSLAALEPLVQGGQVLRAYSRHQLSYLYSYKFLADLGYLGTGFLLHECGGRFQGLLLGPREWARRMVLRGVPTGGRSEAHSAFLGLVATPALALGSIAIAVATQDLQALRQSDESSVFANMTLYHAILISAAAAVGEELVYRAFLQNVFSRWMPMGVAIGVQAVFFGFAHGGYGTWIHVLLPTLFGVVAGYAAWRFGLWMAITLHFMADLYAFMSEATATQAWLAPVLGTLFTANFVLMMGWAALWIWRRFVHAVPKAA